MFSGPVSGQNFIMADGVQFDNCSGFFYDSGGPSGSYGNNEDLTATICPIGGAGAGPFTQITFDAWAVQSGSADKLFIYDGVGTGGTLLITGQGNNSLLGLTFVAADPSGCLTFRWTSSASGTNAGWRGVIETAGDPGNDAIVSRCTSDPPFNMFDQLGGTPDPGGQWTAPNGTNHGPTFDPVTDAAGTYIYTTVPTPPCAGVEATLTVSLQQAPDAGVSSNVTLCDSDAPIVLFDELGGTPDAGGTWTQPNGNNFGGTFNPAAHPPGVYTYAVLGNSPCGDHIATVTVSVNNSPDPGTDAQVDVCSNDPSFLLFDELGGTPDPGGTWTLPNGQPNNGTFTPGVSPAGDYTYTITATPPCTDASAVVTVSVEDAPDPGLNASITLCGDDPPVSMVSQLNGSPDAGGIWTDPDGDPHGPNFDPSSDDPGAYTYTVAGTAPCADESAVLTISTQPAPSAGTNGSITVCASDGSLSLLNALGGSPDVNGSWEDPSGMPHSGMLDPGTDSSGIYVYTVPGVAPCADAMATVTVSIEQPPSAGSNSAVSVCSDDAAFPLIDELGGNPDAGGIWTRPDMSLHGDDFDPALHPPGVYTYTVNGGAACADAVATLDVSVSIAPTAGANGTVDVCSDGGSVQLFTALGGSPDNTGTWTDPDGDPHNGTLDPASDLAGPYVYTVPGAAPCSDATSIVVVNIDQAPNAGSNVSLSVCSDQTPFDLIDELAGTPDPGGDWTDPVGDSHQGTYDPGTQPGGTYTYTVQGMGVCSPASATVQIVRNVAPRAGTDGTITLCSNGAQVQLISVLGGSPDATGSWLGPSGQPYNLPTFDPGSGIPGTFTYIVQGTAPCMSDTAFASINVNTAPNAGNNATTTVCDSDPSFLMRLRLNGTPNSGGTWTDPNGDPHGSSFLPGTHDPGVYTYTVPGNAPCAPATATLNVIVEEQPDAGSNGSITVCATEPAFSLFDVLNGDPEPGGSWSAPGGSAHNGIFVPGTSTPGSYIYSLSVPSGSPCTNASANVIVAVDPAPDAGMPGTLSTCEDAGAIDLFDVLGGTPDGGGTWDNISGQGVLVSGTWDPAGVNPGDYFFDYNVPGIGNCPAAVTRVTIDIVNNLNAGSNATRAICGDQQAYELFNGLNGSPQPGGTWADDDNSGALTGGFFLANTVSPGTYHFTYTINGTAGCSDDSAVLTVHVRQPAEPGGDGNTTVCSDGSPFLLIDELLGNPQTNGMWEDPSGGNHGPNYVPANDVPGIYAYIVSGVAPCPQDTSFVEVTEIQAPNAGTLGEVDVCETDGAFVLLDSLGGSPDPNGSWTGPGGGAHGNTYDPGVDTDGLYVYTVAGIGPCADALTPLTIEEHIAPFAGGDTVVTVCSSDPVFVLLSMLTGSPDTDGAWTDPDGMPHTGFFTPGSSTPGDYQYTVEGDPPCAVDVSTVTVLVNDAPDPGNSSTYTACSDGASVPLLPQLGGTPDPTGTWRDPNGAPHSGLFDPDVHTAGTYTYTVQGLQPCEADSAVVIVQVEQEPDPGTNASILVCTDEPGFDMTTRLGGTPATNGVWRDDMNAIVSAFFVPTMATSGVHVFTYTVEGDAPCSDAVATLTISLSATPMAGNDGSITYCDDQGTRPLFPELGPTAQTGGTWRDPLGTTHSGLFVPGSDQVGEYLYIKTSNAGCANDTARLVVQVNTAANAGINGSEVICDDQNPFNLIDELGGAPQALGTWSDPAAAAHSGVFIPGTDVSGVYAYVVAGDAPCENDTARVTIIQHHQPHAGDMNNVVALCSNDPTIDLFTQISGAPESNGTWLDPMNMPTSGSYQPGSSTPGLYRYTLTATPPCINDVANVLVNENQFMSAGCSSSAVICTDQPPVQLFDLLNCSPSTSGSWSDPNGASHLGNFDPLTDIDGAYRYVVMGSQPCENDTAFVQVTTVPAPNAGTDGDITVCLSTPSVDLITGLNNDPDAGGTWTELNTVGQVTNGQFNSSNMPLGSYQFGYTIAGVGPCPQSDAIVTVHITDQLDAGQDSIVQVCENEEALVLVDQLGGSPDPGGTWLDDDATGEVNAGILNAEAVAQNLGLGTYSFRYVLPTSGGCAADTANLQVQVIDGPSAGTNGFAPLCSSSSPQALQVFLIGSDAGGMWLDTALIPHSGIFDPANDPSGTYTYVVPGIGGCNNDTAQVIVQLTQAADAGVDVEEDVCSLDGPFDLFPLLGGTPDQGGAWTVNNTPHSGVFNPQVDGSEDYDYTVSGTGSCPDVTATVDVTLYLPPDAGIDNAITVCSNDPPFDLIDELAGSPDQGGSWFLSGLGSHGPTFDPSTEGSGTFEYVVGSSGPCPNDTSFLNVTVIPAPDPGIGGTLDTCGGSTLDLFAGLGGTPDLGGVWYDLNTPVTGELVGSILNIGMLTPSQYDFMYVVPGTAQCDSSFSLLTVDLTTGGVFAGISDSVRVCAADPEFNLFSVLSGPPDPGGTWYDDDTTGVLDLWNIDLTALTIEQTYNFTYVVTAGPGGCGTDSATISVTPQPFNDPGESAGVFVCVTQDSLVLIDQLGGAPDPLGRWTRLDGTQEDGVFYPPSEQPGTFVYTVLGDSVCPDTTAFLNVVVNAPPNAGWDVDLIFCETTNSTDLLAWLGNQTDTIGFWNGVDPHEFMEGNNFLVDSTGVGEYEVQWIATSPSCEFDTATVGVDVVPVVKVEDLQRICDEHYRTYTVEFEIVDGVPGTYMVNGMDDRIYEEDGRYIFRSEEFRDSDSSFFTVRDAYFCGTVELELVSPCEFDDAVFVPQSISPDGDGINDHLVIIGIHEFPDNEITIFNRWGGKVYEESGYDNEEKYWDGSGQNAIIEGPLPDATYYYVIDLKNGEKPYTGYIYLNR